MANEVAGLLTLNAGNPDSTTFELHIGKNRIGRVSPLSRPDIAITGDDLVSRNHAILVVRLNDRNVYEYWIYDNEQALGKPSKNGTFINNSQKRLDDKPQVLKDGDRIRCGRAILTLSTSEYTVKSEPGVRLSQKKDTAPTVNTKGQGGTLRQRV